MGKGKQVKQSNMIANTRKEKEVFIEIDGDIFQKEKIQSIQYRDNKNKLGTDNGEYLLCIYMEGGNGSTAKMYKSKNNRDKDFNTVKKLLLGTE